MDDYDDFAEVFGEVFEDDEMLLDSQESLTDAAANLMSDSDSDEILNSPSTPATSQHSQHDISTQQGDVQSKPALKRNRSDSVGRSTVMERIEDIFDKITETLNEQDGELEVQLRARPTRNVLNTPHSNPASSKIRAIRFPGRTANEAWRFTVVIRILELVHEALSTGVVLSKRDIYYRDPALFGTQGAVDRYVDDIAFTFAVPRSQLNVTAAAKGLVAGAFQICRRDGTTINAADDRDGILVPQLRDILSVDVAAVKWILVIEKEATFRSIASSTFWDSISTRGIILTGKGYPDIATRALLHLLSMATPHNGFESPPVFGLADCDPDGLAILSIYRNGSAAYVHENEDLRVPQLQWLGLRVEHMMGESLLHGSQGLLSLTMRDRRRAVKMLERGAGIDAYSDAGTDSDEASHMKKALQTMLMLNTKAELQLLDSVPNGLANLLQSTLGHL